MVAKSFDTESGGWNRNFVEGAGFDTIRVARCHKILSTVYAAWNESFFLLGLPSIKGPWPRLVIEQRVTVIMGVISTYGRGGGIGRARVRIAPLHLSIPS